MIEKKDLYEGNVLKINGEEVKLIKREPSWKPDDIPFCVMGARHDAQVVHAKQRWKVDIGGWVTHRYIEYFLGVGHLTANCEAWFKQDNSPLQR